MNYIKEEYICILANWDCGNYAGIIFSVLSLGRCMTPHMTVVQMCYFYNLFNKLYIYHNV